MKQFKTGFWLYVTWATYAADLQTDTKSRYFYRKDDKDGQLTAAQIYLKLGEVSAESGIDILE